MPPARRRAFGVAGTALALLLLLAVPAVAEPFLGRPLEDALRELQSRGLPIVFTSQLVRPEMRVVAEPEATEPRRILDELLAPHGLRAEEGAGGTLVVVRAPGAARVSGISGTVRSRVTGEPVAGVAVRVTGPGETGPLETAGAGGGVEVETDPAGRFEVRDLAPGTWRLEARKPDYLDAEVRAVRVAADRPAEVELTLQPLPFVEEEIVVRPSRLSLLTDEPDAPLSFSRRDIENLPHLARDVFRALTLMPGATGNDLSAQFHIHGGRRDETQILLDGQELYDAFHLKDFDNAVSSVASQGLDRVSLSTGAFPAHRGDRMSGVLDMRTRSPSGPRRTELGLGLTEAYALSGGGLGRDRGDDRGAWLASARRGFVDLAGRVLGDEDPLFWDLFGKVELRLDDRNHLRGHLLGARDQLDFLRTLAGTTERFDTGYDSTYLWLTHQTTLGDAWLIETTASVSEIGRDRQGGDAAEDERFAVFDHRDTRVLGLAQDWGWQVARGHALEWGFVVRRYDTRYDYFNDIERNELDFQIPQSPQPVPRFQGDFRGDHLGVYVSDRLSPLDRLTLELGLRTDRHTLSDDTLSDDTPGDDALGENTLTDDTLISPRLNAAWRLGNRHVLRGGWGHFHQSQRPYELQVEDGETRFFRAERSEHWVVGYEGILDPDERAPFQALRIEAYRRELRHPRPRYENLFEAVSAFPEVEPDRVRIAPDSGRAEGIEVVLRGAAGRAAHWWVNYALAHATDRIDGREVDRRVDQRHTFNLHFVQPLGADWHLNLAWRFHTGWPTTRILLVEEDPEGPEEPEDGPGLRFALGPLYGERLSSYHRLDLRASRTWSLSRSELTFFLDVQNVYDRRNPSGFDAEIDDETGTLVLSREGWPGILPSVGVRWEF